MPIKNSNILFRSMIAILLLSIYPKGMLIFLLFICIFYFPLFWSPWIMLFGAEIIAVINYLYFRNIVFHKEDKYQYHLTRMVLCLRGKNTDSLDQLIGKVCKIIIEVNWPKWCFILLPMGIKIDHHNHMPFSRPIVKQKSCIGVLPGIHVLEFTVYSLKKYSVFQTVNAETGKEITVIYSPSPWTRKKNKVVVTSEKSSNTKNKFPKVEDIIVEY